jgi:hypothetical protein
MPPSIAQQVAERSENLARKEAKADFFKLMKLLLRHGGAYEAKQYAAAERARPRVQGILEKAAVAGGGIDSWSQISDYINVQQSFQESLRTLSVFDAVLNGGMVRAPLRSRGFSITTGISGSVVGEHAFKPIGSLVLAQQLLELRKASAIVVVSEEVADFPGASQLFADELTRAIIAATDSNFLAGLVAGAGVTTASGGGTAAQIAVDLEVLLSNVTTHAGSRLFLVISPLNLKGIVAKYAGGTAGLFPLLGPLGGEMWPGVVVIPSDSISSSAVVLFDATAIVGNSDAIIPGKSEQSTIQMETSPDSPPTASTSLLSLWQNNLVALKLERFFGYTILRSSGVSALSGVNY